MCDHNRIVAKEDAILWRFEKFLEKDNLHPESLGYNLANENPSTKALSR